MPDFVIALITAPEVRPYSAVYPVVITENSCTESTPRFRPVAPPGAAFE